MIRQMLIGLAMFAVLSGTGLSDDIRGSGKTGEAVTEQLLAQGSSGTNAPASRSGQTPVQSGSAIAQSCPAPDNGEGLCGYYGGYCRYCDVNYPHYCPSNDTCYEHFTGAQSACGNSYVICGGAVN